MVSHVKCSIACFHDFILSLAMFSIVSIVFFLKASI